MSVIPTQIRDYNYQQTAHKIPKQDDLVIEALYNLRFADAEKIQEWVLARHGRQLPLTSVRRSLTNLKLFVAATGKRFTGNGGTATVFKLSQVGIDRVERLPF